MKKVMWVVVIALFVLPLTANAGEVRVGAGGGGWDLGGQQKAGTWKQMTYDTRCPAPLCLLDRLSLTDDQQKVLDEIYTEWSTKQSKAYADAKGKVPKLSAEDQKDPAKMKDYMARRTAAYKEAQVPMPIDQMKNVLTPEQTEKLNAASKVLADWSKWLTEYLAGFDKQLDAILGPAPAERDYWYAWKYTALDNYLKGASNLGDRLGLTKEQEAALHKAHSEYQNEVNAMVAPANAALNAQKDPKDYARAIQSMLYAECQKIAGEKLRLAIEKLLTQDQRDKLAKAAGVVAERDKGLVASYADYAAKINTALPAPARKPGDPIIMRGPGGGIQVMMPPGHKPGIGELGERKVINVGGGAVVLPGQKAGGGGTVIVIGEGGEDKD